MKLLGCLALFLATGVCGAVEFRFGKGEFEAEAPLDSMPPAFTATIRLMPQSRAPMCSTPGMALFAGDYFDNGFSLRLQPIHDGYIAQFVLGGTNGYAFLSNMSPLLKPGRWVRLTGTWNGRCARLYVDGTLTAEKEFRGPVAPPPSGKLEIGRPGCGYGYYPFVPAKAAFLPMALTPDEIRNLVSETSDPESEQDVRRAELAWGLLTGACYPESVLREMCADVVLHPEFRRLAAEALESRRIKRIIGRDKDEESDAAVRIGVSADGDDAAEGTLGHPFATLARARDEVRRQIALGRAGFGISVELAPGYYRQAECLDLGPEDSGVPGRPVVWRAMKRGAVRLSGGWKVPGLEPHHGSVMKCDVKAAGYPHWNERRPQIGRCFRPCPVNCLYEGGVRLTLAREPNDGFFRVPGKDPDGSWLKSGFAYDETKGTSFAIDSRLAVGLAKDPNAMASGYFGALWSDETSYVKINADTAIASLLDSREHVQDYAPYFILNALPLLDAPGEWFLDPESGMLYVWPMGKGELMLSSLDEPLLRMDGAHDLRIEGFLMEGGRLEAAVATNCERIAFVRNEIRNFGTNGLVIQNSREMTVGECVIHSTGHLGVAVSGGDRASLTSGENLVRGNDIYDVSALWRTYAPCLQVEGVGCLIFGNYLHDVPSSVIRLEGNDHVFMHNLVERAVTESDDQGAADIYLDPTYAGCRFAENVWVDIGRRIAFPGSGRAAIRLDGNVSGMTIERNRFVRCGDMLFGAINVNGGRNNVIRDNVFEDCEKGITTFHYGRRQWAQVLLDRRVLRAFERVDHRTWPYVKYHGMRDIRNSDQVNYYIGNFMSGEGVLVASPPPRTVLIGNGSPSNGMREPAGVPHADDVRDLSTTCSDSAR